MRLVKTAADLASLLGEHDVGHVDHVSLAPEMEPGYGGRGYKIAKLLSEPRQDEADLHSIIGRIDAELKALGSAGCRIMVAVNEGRMLHMGTHSPISPHRAYLHVLPIEGFFSVEWPAIRSVHRLLSPCEARLLRDPAVGAEGVSFRAWWSEDHVRWHITGRIPWCQECCGDTRSKSE